MRRALLTITLALLMPALAVAGPKVVVTALPSWALAMRVAPGLADITLLIPAGEDVHEYSLKPHDIRALSSADVIMISGAGLETNLIGRFPSYVKTVDLSAGVEVIRVGVDPDPHVWLDPRQAIVQAGNIRDVLSYMDPSHTKEYVRNADRLIKDLEALDREVEAGLRKLKSRHLITYHNAFGYFARRYGLQPLSLGGLHEELPLPSRARDIYDIIRRDNVPAVFAEIGAAAPAMKRIGDDLGVLVCTIDTLSAGPMDPDYYMKGMRKNLTVIKGCLGGM